MSKIKDRAKMFSNDDKDLEKNLVSNSNPKKVLSLKVINLLILIFGPKKKYILL